MEHIGRVGRVTINIDLISSLVGEKWVSLFPVSGPDGRIGFHEKSCLSRRRQTTCEKKYRFPEIFFRPMTINLLSWDFVMKLVSCGLLLLPSDSRHQIYLASPWRKLCLDIGFWDFHILVGGEESNRKRDGCVRVFFPYLGARDESTHRMFELLFFFHHYPPLFGWPNPRIPKTKREKISQSYFSIWGLTWRPPDGIKMEKVLRCEIAKGRVVTNLIMNGAFDRQTPLSVGMDGHGKKKKMDVFLTHRLPQKLKKALYCAWCVTK